MDLRGSFFFKSFWKRGYDWCGGWEIGKESEKCGDGWMDGAGAGVISYVSCCWRE